MILLGLKVAAETLLAVNEIENKKRIINPKEIESFLCFIIFAIL